MGDGLPKLGELAPAVARPRHGQSLRDIEEFKATDPGQDVEQQRKWVGRASSSSDAVLRL